MENVHGDSIRRNIDPRGFFCVAGIEHLAMSCSCNWRLMDPEIHAWNVEGFADIDRWAKLVKHVVDLVNCGFQVTRVHCQATYDLGKTICSIPEG